jgi:hypothetical protein
MIYVPSSLIYRDTVMKRLSTMALFIGIATMGCSSGTIKLDEIFSVPHAVIVDISGADNADIGVYLNKRSPADTLPSKVYDPERKRDEYLAHPLEKKAAEIPSDKLMQNVSGHRLPFRIEYTIERGDCLHVYCKPLSTTGQIIVQIIDDGRVVKKYTLKPGDTGKYIYYSI